MSAWHTGSLANKIKEANKVKEEKHGVMELAAGTECMVQHHQPRAATPTRNGSDGSGDEDYSPPTLPPEIRKLRDQWSVEQRSIAQKVVLDDQAAGFQMPWEPPSDKPPLTIVGGLDISFVKDTSIAVASLVVLNFPSLTVRRTLMQHCEMKLPYIPSFLAFREVAPLQSLLAQCKAKFAADYPQILFIDGNGVLHHRRCGLASHLGVISDTPCVGCAKKLLAVDGLQRDTVRAQVAGKKTNELVPLIGHSGYTLGFAALTGNSSTQPIFISAGHRISQQSAAQLVTDMCANRVPEPIRQADLLSRQYIRQKEREGFSSSPTGGTDETSSKASPKIDPKDQTMKDLRASAVPVGGKTGGSHNSPTLPVKKTKPGLPS